MILLACGEESLPLLPNERPPEPRGGCPSLSYEAGSGVVPTLFIVDASGSMDAELPGGSTRWQALHAALVGDDGLAPATEDRLTLGAMLYWGDPDRGADCLDTDHVAPRANNAAELRVLLERHTPAGGTPTHRAIDATADYLPTVHATRRPKNVVLLTDGAPNRCSEGEPSARELVLAAAERLHASGVTLRVLGIASGASPHLQAVANVGAGLPADEYPGAPLFTAASQAGLLTALEESVAGPRSCELGLSDSVDLPETGVVLINGALLRYGEDFIVEGRLLRLLDSACDDFKASEDVSVRASFQCVPRGCGPETPCSGGAVCLDQSICCAVAQTDGDICCKPGEVPFHGFCYPAETPCRMDEDCQSAHYCETSLGPVDVDEDVYDGWCLPAPVNPE